MKEFFQKAALATAFITDVITAPVMSLKNCYDAAADWDDETDPAAFISSVGVNFIAQFSAYIMTETVMPDTASDTQLYIAWALSAVAAGNFINAYGCDGDLEARLPLTHTVRRQLELS